VARSAARGWPHLPRRTARLRLTFLYGGLFLACGAILLAVSYVLVKQAIAPWGANVHMAVAGSGQGKVPAGPPTGPGRGRARPRARVARLVGVVGKQIAATPLRQVLIDAPIGLAIVTVVALALGWLAAGRVLRPLATITAAARRISASNLHQRLALRGPDDELKALGDTLDELFARLEAAFDAQRHFAAHASHDPR